MSTQSHHHTPIVIRMGAAHSTISVGEGTLQLPSDTDALWRLGCKLSQGLHLEGKAPGPRANLPAEEPLITINTERSRKAAQERQAKNRKDRNHGSHKGTQPHTRKAQSPKPTQDDAARGQPPADTLRADKDGNAPKGRRRQRRKPRALPAPGHDA